MSLTREQADTLIKLFPCGVLVFPVEARNIGTCEQTPTFCTNPEPGTLPFDGVPDDGRVGVPHGDRPKTGRGRPKLFGTWTCQPWGIWVQAYARTYGCRPVADGPDLNAARRLAKCAGGEDSYRRLVAAFLRDGDRFLIEKRHTLRFCQANLYAEAMQAKPATPPKPDPENYLAALEGRASSPPAVGPGGGGGGAGGDGNA